MEACPTQERRPMAAGETIMVFKKDYDRLFSDATTRSSLSNGRPFTHCAHKLLRTKFSSAASPQALRRA